MKAMVDAKKYILVFTDELEVEIYEKETERKYLADDLINITENNLDEYDFNLILEAWSFVSMNISKKNMKKATKQKLKELEDHLDKLINISRSRYENMRYNS